MATVKKIPERRCVRSAKGFPKKELIRVVRDQNGLVSLDFTGKKAGRGAYICRNAECFRKAVKAKRLENNLNCTIPEELLRALATELEEHGTE